MRPVQFEESRYHEYPVWCFILVGSPLAAPRLHTESWSYQKMDQSCQESVSGTKGERDEWCCVPTQVSVEADGTEPPVQ